MKLLFLASFLLLSILNSQAQRIVFQKPPQPIPSDDLILLGEHKNALASYRGKDLTIVSGEKTTILKNGTLSSDGSSAAGLEILPKQYTITLMDVKTGRTRTFNHERFSPEPDPSLKVHLFPDRWTVLRENVALFTAFNFVGKPKQSVSSAASSASGESISDFASDAHGIIKVVYTPKIKMGKSYGSQAKLWIDENEPISMFYAADKEIAAVKVLDEQETIAIIATADQKKSTLYQFDKKAQSKGVQELDFVPSTIRFLENNKYMLLFSDGRVQLYDNKTKTRIGSGAAKDPIRDAVYLSEKNVILMFTGKVQNAKIMQPKIAVLDLNAKKLESFDFPSETMPVLPELLKLDRISATELAVSGTQIPYRIKVN